MYGGMLLTYTYNYSTYRGTTLLERRLSWDAFFYMSDTYGIYCSRDEAVPLVGTINNIYLQRGITHILLYAFPPFFNISLVIRVVPTECEGVINVVASHCSGTKDASVVTPNYLVRCKPSQSTTVFVLSKRKCVVVQHMPRSTLRHYILYIHSPLLLTTKLILVHAIMIPYWNNALICDDLIRILQHTTDNRYIVLNHKYGKDIGVFTKINSRKPLEYNNIREVNLTIQNMCFNLPKFYYQFKISSLGNVSECPVSELGAPKYRREQQQHVNSQPLMGHCAITILKTFKGYYIINVEKSMIQVVRLREHCYFFVMLDSSCTIHNNVHIYITSSLLYKNYLVNYLLPNTSDRLIFSQYGYISFLIFEVLNSIKCTLSITYNGVYKTPHKRNTNPSIKVSTTL